MVLAAAVFLLLNVVVGVGMRVAGVPGPYGKDWGDDVLGAKAFYLEKLERSGGVSAVFLGASLVGASINPEVLNRELDLPRPTFAGGTNGATPSILNLWSKALVKLTRPKVVFIGLGPGDLGTPAGWRDEQIAAAPRYRKVTGTRDRGSLWKRTMDNLDDAFRWVPLVEWRWNLRELKFVPEMTELGQDTVYGNAVMSPVQPPLPVIPERPAKPLKVARDIRRSLDDLITGLQSSGVRVVLLVMPISSSNARAAGGFHTKGYLPFLESVASKHQVTLVNAEARIGYNDSYFADGLHMNRQGAVAFSEALAAELTENHPDLVEIIRSAR